MTSPAREMATSASTKARRREQTREAMQRMRARQQHELQQLRLTVERLDAERIDLLQRVDLAAPFLALPLPSMAIDNAQRQARKLTEANARLQCAIASYVKWEDRMALLLEDLVVPADNTSTASTPVGLEYVSAPRVSAARAAELMLLHHRECKAVESKWLSCAVSSSSSSSSRQSQFFGWDLRDVLEGAYWHYKFSKRLRNVSAHAVAGRAWRNALHLIVYRTWLPHQRIVQHINDDTFVLARWMPSSMGQGKQPRVMHHLRFRMLDPDGSIRMGMQTLPASGGNAGSASGDMAGCEAVSIVFRFTPEHGNSGEEHCVVEYSGRIQFEEDAQKNALEMVLSLARWEELNTSKAAVNLSW